MKKISRRSFLTAAAACGAAAALSACGGSSASSTAASSTAGSTAASAAAGPVTLQWSVWDKESTPYWQAMADGYMASHKDVTIEMVDLGSSDYMTVLATQLAGSADLDVVTVKDIPGYANLINLDYLKPLNEVLTRDTGDFNGTIEQLTTDDGNFYAVPFRSDFWVLYYNKDLFDAAGVEYPSNDLTMEDYDALARKMTSGSGDTKVYGCHYHTWRSAASLFSILDGKNTIIDGTYDFMKPTYDMVIAQQKDGICMDYGYLKTSSLHYSAAFENHGQHGQLVHLHAGSLHEGCRDQVQLGHRQVPAPRRCRGWFYAGHCDQLGHQRGFSQGRGRCRLHQLVCLRGGRTGHCQDRHLPGLRLRCYRRDHQVHRGLPRGQQFCGCTDHQQCLSGNALHPVRI